MLNLRCPTSVVQGLLPVRKRAVCQACNLEDWEITL